MPSTTFLKASLGDVPPSVEESKKIGWSIAESKKIGQWQEFAMIIMLKHNGVLVESCYK